jgi:hypothetical protein
MNLQLFSKLIFASATIVCISGCEKDEGTQLKGQFSKGVFIINEGNFTQGNASISFYDRDSMKVTNDLFYKVNHRSIGDIAQSMSEHDDRYYMVINNSSKVEIVNKTDFVSSGVIENLIQPRYFLGINDSKAYISQWGKNGVNGSIAVVDLSTNIIIKTLSTGAGAEKMTKINDNVYVVNSGGFGNDSTVAVVNSVTDELVAKIKVGFNPQTLVTDKNNKIWVLCGGIWKSDYSGLEKPGSLVQINPSTQEVETTVNFTSLLGTYVRKSLFMNKSKDKLFYTLDGQLYEHNIESSTAENTPKISRTFYNVGLDEEHNIFYGSDIRNGITNGWIIRYNSSYVPIDSFVVGIYPDEMFFN